MAHILTPRYLNNLNLKRLTNVWHFTGENGTSGPGMPHLRYLTFSGIKAMTQIDDDACCHMYPNIESVWTYSSSVTHWPSTMFARLTVLAFMAVHKCEVTSLSPDQFADQTMLIRLTLEGNNIAAVAAGGLPPHPTEVFRYDMSSNPSVCFQGIDPETGKLESNLTCACGPGLVRGGTSLSTRNTCVPVQCPSTVPLHTGNEGSTSNCNNQRNVGNKCMVKCSVGKIGSAVYTCGVDGMWGAAASTLDCRTTLSPSTAYGMVNEKIQVDVPKSTVQVQWDPEGVWEKDIEHLGFDHFEEKGDTYANIDIVRKCIAKPSVSASTINFIRGIQEMTVQFVYLPEAENGAARKVCDEEFDAMDLQLPGFKISGTVITFGVFRMHQSSGSYYDQKIVFYRNPIKTAEIEIVTTDQSITAGDAMSIITTQRRVNDYFNTEYGLFQQVAVNAGFDAHVVFTSSEAGEIPPGLELDSTSGNLTGTPINDGPKNVSGAPIAQTYTIDVNVAAVNINEKVLTDSKFTVSKYTLDVYPAIEETGAKGYTATVGTQYVGHVPAVQGGRHPLTFAFSRADSTSELPNGLVVDAGTGQITGIPTQETAATTLAVVVTDANGSTKRLQTMELTVRPSIRVTWTEPLHVAAFEDAYVMNTPKLVEEALEIAFYKNVSALPLGLELDAGTGKLYGYPLAPGMYNLTIVAYDGDGSKAIVSIANERGVMVEVAECVDAVQCSGAGACAHGDDVYDGVYSCMCEKKFEGSDCSTVVNRTGETVGGLFAAMLLIIGIGVGYYRWRVHIIALRSFDFFAELERMKESGEIDGNETKVPREIKRTCLTLTKKIGAGQFGEVWKAVLDESTVGGVPGYMVAVKTSLDTEGEGADELIREATVMAQVTGHKNLVSLVGVVTSGAPLLLLVSLCDHGSVLDFLKEAKQTVETKERMAYEIASGMAHLIAAKFIHRDLAARNVLVDSQLTCKVADFVRWLVLTGVQVLCLKMLSDSMPAVGAKRSHVRSNSMASSAFVHSLTNRPFLMTSQLKGVVTSYHHRKRWQHRRHH
jgi:hypothetical protein